MKNLKNNTIKIICFLFILFINFDTIVVNAITESNNLNIINTTIYNKEHTYNKEFITNSVESSIATSTEDTLLTTTETQTSTSKNDELIETTTTTSVTNQLVESTTTTSVTNELMETTTTTFETNELMETTTTSETNVIIESTEDKNSNKNDIINNQSRELKKINNNFGEELIQTKYEIKKGETLAEVAKKFDVKIEDLMKWNNLTTRIPFDSNKEIIVYKKLNTVMNLSNFTTSSITSPSDILYSHLGEGGEIFWSWAGYSEPIEWCAVAVQYCRYMAGEKNVPVVAAVDAVIEGLIEVFSPQKDDLCVIDYNGNGYGDHVTFVHSVVNGIANTIGGNESPNGSLPASQSYVGEDYWTISRAKSNGVRFFRIPFFENNTNPNPENPDDEDEPLPDPTPNGSDEIYIIESGDSLWWIANHFGVTIEELKEWNNLGEDYMLYPGDKIIIKKPASNPTNPTTPEPETNEIYIVESGDSLWWIANHFGVTIEQLKEWNNLGEDYMLHPGDKIIVRN